MPKDTKATGETKTPRARKPAIRRRRTAETPVTHDQIAERAYWLFLGGAEGGPFEHWVQAERELSAAA